MKGFDETVIVYTALWDPDAAPSDPAPKPEIVSQVKPEAAIEVKAEIPAAPPPGDKP